MKMSRKSRRKRGECQFYEVNFESVELAKPNKHSVKIQISPWEREAGWREGMRGGRRRVYFGS